MTKHLLKSISLTLFLLYSNTITADTNPFGEKAIKHIAQYLLTLGQNLGYNLKANPNPESANSDLIDKNKLLLLQNYLYISNLGALPVNTLSSSLAYFVPQNTKGASYINNWVNYSFADFKDASSDGDKVNVSSLLDQKPYQKDPVTQGVQNIITTPEQSFCTNYQGTQLETNCKYLVNTVVTNNVIGELPAPKEFFSFDQNKEAIAELNSSTLIAPLLYSEGEPSDSGASPNPSQKNNQGLKAESQSQAAANFIRYVTGLVLPIALPEYQDYNNLYSKATSTSKGVSKLDKLNAQSTISNYLASLRVYAAQRSVALSNLYYILGKRMPQKLGSDGSATTSQALNEFKMATWRLYNPENSKDQWIDKINNSSSATVQKEIAALLAEINYQLYLNRQQQERILLTNSIQIMQLGQELKPNASQLSSGAPNS